MEVIKQSFSQYTVVSRRGRSSVMSFTNKAVIVTGASSGIGAATAVMFAKEGACVALVGRDQGRLASVSEQCARAGGRPLVVRADVSDADDAKRIIQTTVETFGKIDVLVNNAAIAKFGTLLAGTLMNTLDDVMNTNFRAAVNLTTLATPHLVQSKGNVVNVSAVGGMSPPAAPLMAYCLAKAALNHFTKGAALELAAAGVRVNAVSPGPVRTDILEHAGMPMSWDDFAARTALGKVSEPDEVAELILYLASDKAKSITGSNLVSDNGYLLKK